MDTKEEFLTPKEIAEILKLSPKSGHITVVRWIRRGLLRAGLAGDLVRVRRRDLDDFLYTKR